MRRMNLMLLMNRKKKLFKDALLLVYNSINYIKHKLKNKESSKIMQPINTHVGEKGGFKIEGMQIMML